MKYTSKYTTAWLAHDESNMASYQQLRIHNVSDFIIEHLIVANIDLTQ